MPEKLRVAIIGCGRISAAYANAFKELSDQIEVVMAVDKVIDKAKEYAKQFDCKYSDKISDLYDLNIDVCHIALPHFLHAPVSIDLLNHGINVLTEKPMAITLKDADAMIEASNRNKKLLGCIFQTRYNDTVKILKEKRDRGEFGKILSARSFLTWDRPKDYYQKSDWKGTWDKEGGGVIIDQAIHSLDRVLYIMGSDVEWVEASIHNRLHPYVNIDDAVDATIKFKNGAVYNLYATCNMEGSNLPIEITFVGEKGIFGLKQDVAYTEIDGERTEYRGIEGKKVINKGYWGTTHVIQLREFYNAVKNNTPILVTKEEGRKTLEVVKAIYLAGLKHERIYLPFEDISIPADTKLEY